VRTFSREEFRPVFDAMGGLREGMTPFRQRLTDTRDEIGRLAEDMGGSTAAMAAALEGLGGKAEAFGERFSGVMGGSKDNILDLRDDFGEVFGKTIPEIWRGMTDGMQDVWGNAWHAIRQALGGALRRITEGINGVIDGLNAFRVDMPAWLGGGSFGFSIPRMSVPMLARGGIVSSPTLAMIGEGGREAVLPLENNTGWMADFANVVSEAVAAAVIMGGAGAAGDGRGQTYVNLHLDGHKLAEAVLDDLRDVCGRRDVRLGI